MHAQLVAGDQLQRITYTPDYLSPAVEAVLLQHVHNTKAGWTQVRVHAIASVEPLLSEHWQIIVATIFIANFTFFISCPSGCF